MFRKPEPVEEAKQLIKSHMLLSRDDDTYKKTAMHFLELNEQIAASDLLPAQKVQHFLELLLASAQARQCQRAKDTYIELSKLYHYACPAGVKDLISVKVAELKAAQTTATLNTDFSKMKIS